METSSPVIEVPATPEYVLAVLLERSRQEWSAQAPIEPVTLDSPVDLLLEVCDFIDDMDAVYCLRK
ncbi:MAG: hypothetical protein KDA77_06200 [Planctomycetaceae bacterium]|nr:hypothetical protein [Planctomycetaceae bacterium]